MATSLRENSMLAGTTRNGTLASKEFLIAQYNQVRQFSEHLCKPLVTEDYVIQSMPDVSPTKWHLAHTSWFFEALLLSRLLPDYQSLHPQYAYLFNSYYVTLGERHCRPKRGLISRPTVEQTYEYRRYVDQNVLRLLERANEETMENVAPIIVLGLHHEQQHQELMVTDIKHVFATNPLRPAYVEQAPPMQSYVPAMEWISFPEGIYQIGYAGDGFAYDNESPQHREFVPAFRLASRLVTNGEYLAFMEDGGYERPELWLSAGWYAREDGGWEAPFYWEKRDGQWWMMTLAGMRPVVESEPVCHVSYFEASAYARWSGARLPTEAEWEVAAASLPIEGNFVEDGHYHPVPLHLQSNGASRDVQLYQMFGDVWEWTQSSYSPYPGYRPEPGALGEYNGKFMCNQYVLRGGSCATSISHIRRTYRNFFSPESRWQFMGLRLAQEV